MIIEKKNPLFGRFGDFVPGTVFIERYEGCVDVYIKMQAVIISKGGQADTLCNAVNLETGEWAFFNDSEEVTPYINAKVVLE